jgi:hypothetical protein
MGGAMRGKFQFSIRTLLLVTAVTALLLVPLAWVTQQRQQMLQAERAMLRAREVALRSVVLEAQRRRDQAAAHREEAGPKLPALEQLRRENAELRQQVQELKREAEQLGKSAKPADAKPR